MAKKKSSADGAWLSPAQALEDAQKSLGKVAAKVIRERLRAGQLLAHAQLTSERHGNEEPDISDEILPIPATFWVTLQDESVFWSAGDAQFFFYDPVFGNRTVHCSGIRFLKKTIKRMLPAPVRTDSAPEPSQPPKAKEAVQGDPKPKGPAVSPKALEAWYVAYQLAYQGKEDTLAKAYSSAEGMFPDKFVSRQRIRDLVGGRKAGRKPE
jgi:hypothetical protein